MLELITEKENSWDRLKKIDKPIFIYGMGDGAVKIIRVFEKYGIALAGIFASDEFVRGHSFCGHLVHTLSQIEEAVDDFVIVLAFGVGYKSLYDKIHDISSRHMLLAPDVPVIEGELFTYEYCKEHENELEKVYSLLADDISKQTFIDVINFRISGKIEYLDRCTTEKSDVFENILKLGDEEIYIDMGAYNGDTCMEFVDITKGKYKQIYALEPDSRNFKKLEKNTLDIANISRYNSAAWDSCKTLVFEDNSGRNSKLSTSNGIRQAKTKEVSAISGDSLCKNASYIKMDVEGAEWQAIHGCRASIENGASLAVALYHRTEDIFTLPLLINEINPNLKLYIRHQMYIPAWETNLYAV